MKAAAVLIVALAPAAHAQIIECPKFYPWQDTPIAEVPYQHAGKGFVARASLSGAGIYTGEINGQGEMHGDRRKVKGGWDVHHGFAAGEKKWIVCSYGDGGVTWREELNPKVTSCTLQVREGGRDPMSVKASCR